MDKKWRKFLEDESFRIAEDLPNLNDIVIPLPSPSINWALGNGGLVEGKWVLLFGPESGGKSLIKYVIMAAIQKKYPDGICIDFDTEFSTSKEWFAQLGGDPSRLFLKQTNNPADIFDWVDQKLKPKLEAGLPLKALAIDSVAAIRYPKDETETTKNVMGGTGAAYLPRALKMLIPTVRPRGITTILVQQVREEIDMYKKGRNPWVIPDGRALKHQSDYMIQVERLDTKEKLIESETGVITGHTVRMVCKKNKTGAPYRKVEFTIDYNKGIVGTESEIYNLARKLEIVTHPLNKETGEIKTHSWILSDNPEEIYGSEEEIKSAVVGSLELQQRILSLVDSKLKVIVEEPEIKEE